MSERVKFGVSIVAALCAAFMAMSVFSNPGRLAASCTDETCRSEVAANAWNPLWATGHIIHQLSN